MTAQIAGHEVVYSIISEKTEDYSFLVAAPSRQNAQNAPAFTVVVNWQSTLRH